MKTSDFSPESLDLNKLMNYTLREVMALIDKGGFKIKLNFSTDKNILEVTLSPKDSTENLR